MRMLFFDLETTGLSPKFESILEIAAVLVDNKNGNLEMIDGFHEYIRPYRTIPTNIIELTGISNDMVRNCRNEKAVLDDFASWIAGNNYSDAIPVAHNGGFDFRFLVGRSEFYHSAGQNLFNDMQKKLIDTLPIARKLVKEGKIKTEENRAKLQSLADSFNIKYDAHSAIEDTKALVMVYQEMMKLTGGC